MTRNNVSKYEYPHKSVLSNPGWNSFCGAFLLPNENDKNTIEKSPGRSHTFTSHENINEVTRNFI